MRRVNNLPKSLLSQLSELLLSLQVIRDSIDGLNSGKSYQVIPLSGQLRAVLTDRSKGAHRLLIEVVAALGLQPKIWVLNDADGYPPGLAAPILRLIPMFSAEQEVPGQHQIDLEKLSEYRALTYDGHSYTVADIIKFYAERSGGSHYSRTVPEDFAAMFQSLPFVRDSLDAAMRQLGQCIFAIGLEVIRALADFDIHLEVCVIEQKPTTVLNLYSREVAGSVQVMTSSDNHLVAIVAGFDGASMSVRLDRWLPLKQLRVIHLSLRHDESLNAVLSLQEGDGEASAVARAGMPIVGPLFSAVYRVSLHATGDVADSTTLVIGALQVTRLVTPGDLFTTWLGRTRVR